ncbi:hypothetical protein [Actinoplanes sp. GCM10030250]|uniref:hypothetical protein n=1 Tax=Actinoplanes sp. GCM10030250 TaxID=3273376 RepID=UPI0036194118
MPKNILPRGLIRVAVLTMLAVAGAAVTSASPAAAAISPAGITFESHNFFPLPGQTTVEGTVFCSAGTQVVAAAAGGVILDTLRPVASTMVNATGRILAAGGALTVTATCVPVGRLGNVTTISKEFPSKGAAFRHDFLQCPAGFYAFGGGGHYVNSLHGTSPNGRNMVSNAPSADGTKWTFAGTDNVLSDSMVITTQCAQMANPRRDQIIQAGVPSVAGNFVGDYANCPAGWTAISGGVYLTNRDGSEAPGRTIWSVPATRAGGISSWFASGQANTAANTKTNTLAQCIF